MVPSLSLSGPHLERRRAERDQGKKTEEENLQLLNVLLIDNAFVPGNCYLWEISENIYPIYLKSGPP